MAIRAQSGTNGREETPTFFEAEEKEPTSMEC
jgi:hypothetical protein